MKIGVISDSHDNIVMIKNAVDLFKEEKVDLVFHAGDHVAPFTTIVWRDSGFEALAVYGNNDGDHELLARNFKKIGKIYDRPKEFVINGKKILLMHEPDNLREIELSGKYDIVIYGHTHRKSNYRNGKTIVINPGEACGWITGEATCMTLEIESGEVTEHILGFSPLPALVPAKVGANI